MSIDWFEVELRHDGALDEDRDDWPTHQPIAPEAPIPGRNWYGACSDSYAKVAPDGICEECGEKACPVCGSGFWDDGICQCTYRRRR